MVRKVYAKKLYPVTRHGNGQLGNGLNYRNRIKRLAG